MRIAVFVLVMALAAPAVPVRAASVALPATPAGQRLQAYLTALNSGSPLQFRKYLEKYNPKAVNSVTGQMQFYAMTGGFDVRQIVSSTPTKIVVLVQERLSDSFARITMEVAPRPPHKLVGGNILPADRPAAFALPHMNQTQLLSALQSELKRQTDADRFSGTVLVAHNGTAVFQRAYNLADREKKTPNRLDTRYRLGSMNKMFTATAVMQLVQAGKIDLDRPFETYLPDYPNKSVSSQVTIRELLSHTGGTGDFFGPVYEKNRTKIRTLQDYIKIFGNRRLLFKPGSKFDYSNFGFIILGAVIEKVSGRSYYDYVRDNVYLPAGMLSSGSEPESAAVPNRAIGYMLSPALRWTPANGTLGYRGSSAGGGYATAADMLRFANALLSHKLLNARNTQLMTTGKVSMVPGGAKYGFGFGERTIDGIRCFGHNGGAPGMNGDLEICPANGYTVIVLSNFDPPAGSRIADFVLNRLPK